LVIKIGNDGKWKTAHQQSKMAVVKDSIPQPGDVGIWVTCARHQERKAGREVLELFEKVRPPPFLTRDLESRGAR